MPFFGGGIGTISAGTGIAVTNTIGPNATVAFANMIPGDILGNVTTIAAQPASVPLASSMAFIGNALSLNTIAAGALFGNAGTVGAVPGALVVGANLSLTATGTLNATGGGGGGGIGTLTAGGIVSSAASIVLPNAPVVTKPTFTTWLNQNGATETDNATGSLVIGSTATPGNSSNNTVRYKTLAAGAFSLVVNLTAMVTQNGNGPTMGLCLTNGTALITFDSVPGRTFATGFTVSSWSSTTGFLATLAALVNYTATPNYWMRITFDGVLTYTFSFSMDGFTWIQLYSTAALPITSNGVGIVLNTLNNVASGMFAAVNYWAGA